MCLSLYFLQPAALSAALSAVLHIRRAVNAVIHPLHSFGSTLSEEFSYYASIYEILLNRI